MIQNPIEHADIEKLIPHAGAMCLLERITAWSNDQITAQALNHRDLDHPLRSADGLSVLHTIEYAAQAVAAQASLIAKHQNKISENYEPRQGRLVSVRDFESSVSELSRLDSPLIFRCQTQNYTSESSSFFFEVFVADLQSSPIASGRVTVMFIGGA